MLIMSVKARLERASYSEAITFRIILYLTLVLLLFQFQFHLQFSNKHFTPVEADANITIHTTVEHT